ncbi:uncharacterized protein PgNI_02814 [Pyricularia grisea]|uniref:Uncharacterized protein n=1 Tax=Pyricularia grisea TaxID=148305 RepID=A0A6P8BEN7_PYRGI|nr:uncharacterized protein PgNI_02814 [Pyricularia grisea]TLD14250.1 hypothetical protein PgNI_02814 [Pyricularia grisea]
MHHFCFLSLAILLGHTIDPAFATLSPTKKPEYSPTNAIYVLDFRTPSVIEKCGGFICKDAKGKPSQLPEEKANMELFRLWPSFADAWGYYTNHEAKKGRSINPGYMYEIDRVALNALRDLQPRLKDRTIIASLKWHHISVYEEVGYKMGSWYWEMLHVFFLSFFLIFSNTIVSASVSTTKDLVAGQSLHHRSVPDSQRSGSYLVDLLPPGVLSKCKSFNCHIPDREASIGETVTNGKIDKIPFSGLKLWRNIVDAYQYIVNKFPRQFAYIYHIDGDAIKSTADSCAAIAKISWSNVLGYRLIKNKSFTTVEEPNPQYKATKKDASKKGAGWLKRLFSFRGRKKSEKKCKSTGSAARAGATARAVRRPTGDGQDAVVDCGCS